MSFNETLSRHLERLSTLDARERKVLKALISFLAVLLVYFGIWSPLHRYHESSLIKRDAAFGLLQYMRSSEKQARTVSVTKKQRPTGQSLITDISNVAKDQGIQPNRIQPEGGTAVIVWFDNVVFNDYSVHLAAPPRQLVLRRVIPNCLSRIHTYRPLAIIITVPNNVQLSGKLLKTKRP